MRPRIDIYYATKCERAMSCPRRSIRLVFHFTFYIQRRLGDFHIRLLKKEKRKSVKD